MNGRLGALAVWADAVERAGDDAGGSGLSHSTHPRQHEGVRDPPCGKGIGQGTHQGFLPDQAGEIAGAVFAREDAIGLGGRGGFGHGRTIASSPQKGAGFGEFLGEILGGKVEAGDPQQIRYGCSVPGLTRLARAAPTDFRAGI